MCFCALYVLWVINARTYGSYFTMTQHNYKQHKTSLYMIIIKRLLRLFTEVSLPELSGLALGLWTGNGAIMSGLNVI